MTREPWTARPNELTLPGERAARERADAIFAAADSLSAEDLHRTVVPRRDLEERQILLADLERLADGHGRGSLLDESRRWLRDGLLVRAAGIWTSGSRAMPVGTGARAEDEVQLVLAIEDAVSVAVVEDLLEPAAAATLANPGRWLLGLEPLPGAAAGRAAGDDWTEKAAPSDEPGDPDTPPDAETAADAESFLMPTDAAAADEMSGVDARARRAAVFAIVAAVAIPGAVAGGFGADQLPLIVVIVAAVAILAWLFG